MKWRTSADCPHMNDNACPTCDFDRYYAKTYPDCPWAVSTFEREGTMEYTFDELVDLIARHDEHEDYYRVQMANLNAKNDDALVAKTVAEVVAKVRANCTLPTELVLKGGDQIIYAVANWIESPPEWVRANWKAGDGPLGWDHIIETDDFGGYPDVMSGPR